MIDKNMKIIVADVDSSFSESVKDFLIDSGFSDIKIVSDFTDFSGQVTLYNPDVIIMDVILPGIDGLQFIKNIKAHSAGGVSPEIIVASAFYNERYIKESSVLGVFGYFIKPVSLSVISDSVCNIFQKNSFSGTPYGTFSKSSISIIEEPVAISSFSVERGSMQRRLIVKITQLLHDMGIPAHLCGHDYLRDAILMVMESHEISGRMTKEIYPEIANKYKKSPQSVERAIRTALDVAWTRGKTELINEIFRFTVNIQKGRPTNSEFVSLIADYLNYECMSAV